MDILKAIKICKKGLSYAFIRKSFIVGTTGTLLASCII